MGRCHNDMFAHLGLVKSDQFKIVQERIMLSVRDSWVKCAINELDCATCCPSTYKVNTVYTLMLTFAN